jgi:hypothetical protein
MNRPIRTTVVYALISGFVVVPAALLMSQYLAWSMALKLALWTDIALYGVLLARWSDTRLLQLFFPLAVLLGAALWQHVYSGFFILALGVFSWLRSGICFQGTPIRSMMAEVVTMVAGAVLLIFFNGHTPMIMALNICLFFLVQSLYYFWVPVRRSEQDMTENPDAFEQAVENAKKILNGI